MEFDEGETMIKVVKFGGSSLASAEQFKKVGNIIRAEEERRYVVPSAPGKRFSEDIKVTDMLYKCYAEAENGKNIDKSLQAIKERYDEIIKGLGLKLSLADQFKTIKKNFENLAGSDYAASRGEYLNGIIMAEYLGYEFIDAATVIFFDKNGEFDSEKTNETLQKKLAKVERAVIPGFYGVLANGKIKTFSRGGSDVTGSIVARAVKADVYENWTDVSGFMAADPRIVKNPKSIDVITYRELRELSYMGASVLHESAIFPVRKEGIPINIRNTNAPQDKGTMIVGTTCNVPSYTITGIAGKKGFVSISIDKELMNSEIGFGRKVLQVFEDNGISFEHMPSGIDTMTVFVHQDEFVEKEQKVLAGLHRAVNPDTIELESDLSLIAVVGRGMKNNSGIAGAIFSALAKEKINIKMIDQGSSELNIIIGVRNKYFEDAIRTIYGVFVQEEA
jgi:aspartate kinase